MPDLTFKRGDQVRLLTDDRPKPVIGTVISSVVRHNGEYCTVQPNGIVKALLIRASDLTLVLKDGEPLPQGHHMVWGRHRPARQVRRAAVVKQEEHA